MPIGNRWQVPPLPDRTFQATGHSSFGNQKDGSGTTYTEIVKDLFNLRGQIFGADPQSRRHCPAADGREPAAQLVPDLPMTLRNRVRDQTPSVRSSHLAGRVDPPIT